MPVIRTRNWRYVASGARSGTEHRGTRRIAFVLLLVAALPIALWLAMQVSRLPLGTARALGHDIAFSSRGERELQAHAARWAEQPILIRVGPYVAHGTRGGLGARLQVAAATQRLLSAGRSGNPLRDLTDLWLSHREGLELAMPTQIDRARIDRAVEQLRAQIERPPVSGTRTQQGSTIEGIPGITINTLTAREQLEAGLRAGTEQIRLPHATWAPPSPIAYDDSSGSQFQEHMLAFSTEYRATGEDWGRAQNIEAAASALDGARLSPGARLSFNERVGERSFERGFHAAKEIVNQRIVDGLGGGVCQVAATLYAAAFLGGFDIPVYQPHSRPVSYIETGLDTMVAWPDRDLVVANPYPFSVLIRARAVSGTLSVEIYGAARAHPVEWNKRVVEQTPMSSQELPDQDLPRGARKVLQEGKPGQTILRQRITYLPSGPVTEVLRIRYPPVDRLVAVGS